MRHPRRKGRKAELARKKQIRKRKVKALIEILSPCPWCGSTIRGHYFGCPDLEG